MEREVKTHQLGREAEEAVGVGMGVQRAAQQTDGFQVRVGDQAPKRAWGDKRQPQCRGDQATWPGGRGPLNRPLASWLGWGQSRRDL